jgi:hypothetical protein
VEGRESGKRRRECGPAGLWKGRGAKVSGGTKRRERDVCGCQGGERHERERRGVMIGLVVILKRDATEGAGVKSGERKLRNKLDWRGVV